MSNNSIVLMGVKHCGKSTQGKLLAKHFKVDFFDTDAVIEQISGMPFRELYKKAGPSGFARAEETACHKIISENKNKRIIVSTGGGICDNPPALNELRVLETFVFLRLDIETSISRITSKIVEQPDGTFLNVPAYVLSAKPKTLEDIHDILKARYQERFIQYENIADVIVDLKEAPVGENFKSLLEKLS